MLTEIKIKRVQKFEFFCIFNNSWQEWAEGFQTLDDLQSVNLTPEDERCRFRTS